MKPIPSVLLVFTLIIALFLIPEFISKSNNIKEDTTKIYLDSTKHSFYIKTKLKPSDSIFYYQLFNNNSLYRSNYLKAKTDELIIQTYKESKYDYYIVLYGKRDTISTTHITNKNINQDSTFLTDFVAYKNDLWKAKFKVPKYQTNPQYELYLYTYYPSKSCIFESKTQIETTERQLFKLDLDEISDGTVERVLDVNPSFVGRCSRLKIILKTPEKNKVYWSPYFYR